MAFISKESIDEVTSKTDIIRLVGEYVQLEQKGNDWWGCCPFHHEKTPSFSVSSDKGFYYCFGCHASGTAIQFISEMEKLSFAESIEFLAKKAGVTLKYEQNGTDARKEDPNGKLKEEIKNLYTRVAGSFHFFLMESQNGKFALDYIMSRGLTKETLEKFKIGYSPADRKWLYSFLRGKNYSPEFLSKTGLFSSKYPEFAFFSDRLMFPIFDRKGDVVAMGGRFLRGDSQKSPKYLNSGDLIHYKKGSILYAFNFAKNSIREQKKVIFCEGYMDCVAYHQCGITWAVASLGTALTEDQIRLIKPFVTEVYLSFDSDNAGQNATHRAILMCRKMDLVCKVIQIHNGKDPAEIMLNFGAEYLTKEVESAKLDSDFLLNKLLELYTKDTPEGKTKASLVYFEFIDCLQSDIQKDACLDRFCQTFNVEKEAVRKDYKKRDRISAVLRNTKSGQNTNPVSKKVVRTAELQAVMLAVSDDPSFFKQMNESITIDYLTDENSKLLFSIMNECIQDDCFSVSSILNRIENDELKSLIIQTAKEHSTYEKESLSESIDWLKKNHLERRRGEIAKIFSQVDEHSLVLEPEKLTELLLEKKQIDSLMNEIKE